MRDSLDQIRAMPLMTRCAVLGAMLCGVPGAIAGLVVGLDAHPATAWFAMFELGLPAAIVGSALGLAAGSAVTVVQMVRRVRAERLH